jgi:hypothetical protein
MKKGFWFCLFFLGGILLGTVLAAVAREVSWLSWLTWGESIGIGVPSPVTVDLSVVVLTFGFSLKLDIARLIGILTAMIFYGKVGKRL